jgi:hypothetical protein
VIPLLLWWVATDLPADLDRLAREFPFRGPQATLAALDQLVREHPGDGALPRALVWIGRLRVQAGDLGGAQAAFARAAAGSREDPWTRWGALGEGELALAQGRFDLATLRLEPLRADPDRALRAIALQRLAQIRSGKRRRAIDRAALGSIGLWLAIALGLAWRQRRSARPRLRLWPPAPELLYFVPVAALLITIAALEARTVAAPLAWAAAAMVPVLWLNGAATRALPTRMAGVAYGAALVLAVGGLLYGVAYRTGLLDALAQTLSAGGNR